MNNSIIREILKEYERKRNTSIKNQQIRKQEIYRKIPRIKEIDNEITKTGLLISKQILKNPQSYTTKINEIKTKMSKLKEEKAYLMTENNIPHDYLEIKYECSECKDTGYYQNGQRCYCLKQKLVDKAYEMSNISNILQKENFQTFDISIFTNEPYNDEELTPRENIMNISSISEGFVINFDKDNGENLLFYGNTGLGKTFICNCIAKSLLDKGKIVIYQTAFKMMELIKKHKFDNINNNMEYDLLFNSDLLIIDDLGTENTTSFTNTEIFNIVNTRLLNLKKTIISTNLSPKEFADTYTDRTYSRIFSNFKPLKFYGPDLRWEM